MKPLRPLLVKELRALFSSPLAYALMSVFLFLLGYTFNAFLFLNKTSSLVHIFFQAAVLFVLVTPVLTMRQFAEERKTGTLELLLTAPVREIHIVLAKFLASMAVHVLLLVLSLLYAGVLACYSDVDWGPVYSGYLGLLLLSSTLVALGLSISALTSNQMVAAIVALGVFVLLWMLDTLGALLPYPVDNIVLSASFLAHFTPFATGALYLSDAGFFLSLTLLGLFLSVRALVRH